jgi:hypothetical protein
MVSAAFGDLAPTNPHWARMVGYGPFSLCYYVSQYKLLTTYVTSTLVVTKVNKKKYFFSTQITPKKHVIVISK